MDNLLDEVRADVRYYHGERFASSRLTKKAISGIDEAIAVHNAMTKDEQNAVAYLYANNPDELHALYVRVKERAGL